MSWDITTDTVDVEIDMATETPMAADWGEIGGTLSDQTDLQTALNAKLSEAPTDGKTYGRKNGAWAEVTGGGGGGGTSDHTQLTNRDAANQHPISAIQGLQSALDGKGTYSKPASGIPKADMASDVQTSLGKADTAIQEHQSLADYATQAWVEAKGYLTQHQSLAAYRTAAEQDEIHDSTKQDTLTTAQLAAANSGITSADKTKLDGIAAGAEVNVNADWNATSGDAKILNKPTIPSTIVEDVTLNGTSCVSGGTAAVVAGPPCLTGSGAPTSSTVGVVGQLYLNTSENGNNGALYRCSNVNNGVYTWKRTPFIDNRNNYIFGGNFNSAANGCVIIGSNGVNVARNSICISSSNSSAWGDGSVAIGYNTASLAAYSICIGELAEVSDTHSSSIQIGKGNPGRANVFCVGFNAANTNFRLLDGVTGLIPPERLSAINTSTAASITLANAQSHVVTNLPTALEITLPTPTAGCDFLTGAIFRAGSDFALTENAPNDWTIHYEDTPEWTAGKMYEIIYRALWLPISIGETDVSAGTVAVDSLTFQSTNAAVGDYVYTYDGTDWKDSSSTTVTLATLGITLTGTAANGDTITISNLKCISAKVAEVTA